jgi:diguanylate cyclase (GGDEF)-like protein/PAS domain S-box-containing protein
MIAADGRVVWLRDIIRVLVEDDEPRELVGIMVDLTERKRIETLLRENEERLQLSLRGADLALWDWNVQTGQITFNERWAEMIGYSLEEIEPNIDFWERLVHREDLPQVMKVLNDHLEGKTAFFEKEYRIISKSGDCKWILDRGKVFERDKDGRPIRVAGTFLDITDRKRAEEIHMAATQVLEEYKENLEARNKNLSILSKISEEIHQSIDLDDAYRIVFDAIKDLNFVDLMALYLVEEDGDRREAVLQIHRGYPEEYLNRASRIPYPKGNTWRVIESGKLVYYENASDPSTPVGEAGKALGQRALLSIPIKLEQNEVVGVLHFSSSNRTSFSQQEFDFLISLGNQIGTAIAKARMFEEMKKREEELREREERLRKIFEDGPLGMAIVDLDYRFSRVNHTLCQMVGYTEEELTALTFPDITYPEDIDTDIRYAEQLARKEITRYKMDKRYIKKNKEIIWVTLTASIILDRDGNPLYYLAMIEDITERKRAEEAIQQSNEKLMASVKELEHRSHNRTLLNEMGDLLQTCLNVEEAYDIIAKFAQQLFPGESGALCILDDSQNNVETVAAWGESSPTESIFAPEDCWALRRGKAHAVGNSGSEPICRHITHPPSDGYLCVPMMSQGKALGTLCLLKSPDNVHQSKEILLLSKESVMQQLAIAFARQVELALANLKLRETLHNQAIRDPLTGLFNRRYLEESLKREIYRAERKGTSLGIIMLDIDHFKRFNDTHGHAAGDALLHELGKFLKAHIRGADIACRYGGEEFTLILPDVSVEDARQRAEQLRERVRYLKVQDNNQTLNGVTLSLGVAVFPLNGSTMEAVLRAADLALYRAKHEGRNRVVVSQEVAEETTRRSAIA